MTVLQVDIPIRGPLDSSSEPSNKLSVDYHHYTRSDNTGLMTPPLPSPCSSSHAEELSQGTTPPRETDTTQRVRLPSISELLKFLPSPETQLPAPLRQSMEWSSMNGVPTPDFTPLPSPTGLCGVHFASPGDQSLPVPPIDLNGSHSPLTPTNLWTHLPPLACPDPGLSHKTSRTLLLRKQRREDSREERRRTFVAKLWAQPGASPSMSLPPHPRGLTPPPARETHHLRHQYAQADPSLSALAPKKKKKENTPYTQQQEFFIRYFVVDLGYSWDLVQKHYMHWFPSIHRTVGALTCEYYRTNKQIPILTADGLLVFNGPLSKRKYRGLRYACKEQQCRKDKIHALRAIFPEEYEDLGNGWILPEHRGVAREAAERRREQRARERRRYQAKL